jgi:hypothetical protein
MRYILLALLLLTEGCSYTTQEDRLKRIDEMSTNEMRNTLRVCAMNDTSWHTCYTTMFLYKDAP